MQPGRLQRCLAGRWRARTAAQATETRKMGLVAVPAEAPAAHHGVRFGAQPPATGNTTFGWMPHLCMHARPPHDVRGGGANGRPRHVHAATGIAVREVHPRVRRCKDAMDGGRHHVRARWRATRSRVLAAGGAHRSLKQLPAAGSFHPLTFFQRVRVWGRDPNAHSMLGFEPLAVGCGALGAFLLTGTPFCGVGCRLIRRCDL